MVIPSAQKMAVVGQENDVPFNFMVEEIVAMGRSPYKKLFDGDTAEDKRIVEHSLHHLGMEKMAKRNYLYLSAVLEIWFDRGAGRDGEENEL